MYCTVVIQRRYAVYSDLCTLNRVQYTALTWKMIVVDNVEPYHAHAYAWKETNENHIFEGKPLAFLRVVLFGCTLSNNIQRHRRCLHGSELASICNNLFNRTVLLRRRRSHSLRTNQGTIIVPWYELTQIRSKLKDHIANPHWCAAMPLLRRCCRCRCAMQDVPSQCSMPC